MDYRYAKAFNIQKLSIEQGLSQSVVNKIVQDDNGFIWLATEDGLNRFDGYDFKIYQHDHKKPLSLHENWIVTLAVAGNKGLWVGTVSGLSFMDFTTENFINFGSLFSELDVSIKDILYLKGYGVFVATRKGLYFRSKDKKIDSAFEKILLGDNEPQILNVESLSFSNDYLYTATANCIFKISLTNDIIENLCDTEQLAFLIDKEINKILIDKDILWIATTSGLFQYNVKTKQVKSFYQTSQQGQSIASNYVQDLILDADNDLWISTISGISIFNRKTHKFTSHTQTGSEKNQLSSLDILTSFIDKEGLVWLGTYGRGINLLNPNQQRFEHIFTQQDALKLNSNNTIHGIEKDQYENLWLASYGGGLIKYNLMTGDVSRPLDEKNITHDHYVFSLKIDKLNRLWIATFSEIILLDIESETVINSDIYVDGELEKESLKVSGFYEDHLGVLWVLGETGLYQQIISDTKPENKDGTKHKLEFVNWTDKIPYTYKEKSDSFSTMAEDSDGNFWIGGDGGLLFLNQQTGVWKHYTYDITIPNSLSSDSVQSIYIDDQGFVWVGTADGLNRVIEVKSPNQSSYHFERITTHEGLPSNSIYGIQQDKYLGLWLSTSRGLVKYNRSISKMDLFKSSDGLSSDEFNLGGGFSDENSRVYFTSINGVSSIIDPSTRKQIKTSNIKFVKVKLGSTVLDSFKLNLSNEFKARSIQYGTAIEIWVSAMNYFKFGVPRYRYRISGLDDKWVDLGENRKLFIAGLAAGTYIIEIQSRSSGEPWPSNSIKLLVKVNSDFFKSRRFIFLSIFLAASLFLIILFVMSRKFSRRIASELKKQSLEKLRIKELRVDNNSLVYAVSDRDRTISRLNNELEITNNKVDTERYRDISTGFYRFSFVLDASEKQDKRFTQKSVEKLVNTSVNQTSLIRNYGLAAIIEFTNYSDIVKTFGILESNDFISQISIELRRETNADTQFYTLEDGTYILFNASINKQEMLDSLTNLCLSFNSTSYEIANGRSVDCQTRLTYVDLDKLEINSKKELAKVKRLILIAHKRKNKQQDILHRKITKELKILRPLSCESLTDDFDFDVLIEDGTLLIVD